MCGIAGFWSLKAWSEPDAIADSMGQALKHRGPDSHGIWGKTDRGIHFSHRRLAILDLSTAGRQPMLSANARYCMVFNGEIYNHLAIREELAVGGAQVRWRGHADTETLLEAINFWGLAAALKRCNGMFAFAIYDQAENTLSFARDRLGEKPLYIGAFDETIVFGSELQALRVHPAFRGEIDTAALRLFLAKSNVPAPHCIYRHVNKLLPGHLLTLKTPRAPLPPSEPYWSLKSVASAGITHALRGSDNELTDQLAIRLQQAVRTRLISDVPLGAFLSGGYDSSLVVALMQSVSSQPVRTFTIGFDEPGYNEAPHARAVAKSLGTQHTELYLQSKQALEVIPLLPMIYTEPFADASQIPTILVSAMTRESVTVSLSGDGGDELFAGYARYQDAMRLWSSIQRLPALVRKIAAASARNISPALRQLLEQSEHPIVRRGAAFMLRAEQLAPLIDVQQFNDLFEKLLTNWSGKKLLNSEPPITAPPIDYPEMLSPLQRMMFNDLQRYLPDTILTKVDRASMCVGLESRAPLLDHELVEFAWRLPDHVRIRNDQGKWLMRQVLHRFLPRSIMERPKMGFGVPIGAWLRGPLREWAEALLDPQRLKQDGYFNVELVRRTWRQHCAGKWDHNFALWPVLMFLSWHEQHLRVTALR